MSQNFVFRYAERSDKTNYRIFDSNIIYKPYEVDTFLDHLNKRDKLISHGGITVNNALIPRSGTSQTNFNYDSKGNLFGSYSYSLSNIFQIEAINVGSFKDVKLAENKKKDLNSTYLGKNNLNFRLGGKLLIFSPQKDDSLWLTLRTSFGKGDPHSLYAVPPTFIDFTEKLRPYSFIRKSKTSTAEAVTS